MTIRVGINGFGRIGRNVVRAAQAMGVKDIDFVAVNDMVVPHLVSHGHPELRAAHGAVFQYLSDTGTTVSRLAERAQMTKQAMAELVLHLERHGYVTRVPDPHDGRAKLVLPTARGREVAYLAQGLVPELEERIARTIGQRRLTQLRTDLERIRQEFAPDDR